MIQVKFVDTDTQTAGFLTKQSFPRDMWNRLMQLFNITLETTISCSYLKNCAQEQESGSVATSRSSHRSCALIWTRARSRSVARTGDLMSRFSDARDCRGVAHSAEESRCGVEPKFEGPDVVPRTDEVNKRNVCSSPVPCSLMVVFFFFFFHDFLSVRNCAPEQERESVENA